MRYAGGVTGYLEVLTNETAFSAELTLVQARQTELLARSCSCMSEIMCWMQWHNSVQHKTAKSLKLLPRMDTCVVTSDQLSQLMSLSEKELCLPKQTSIRGWPRQPKS